MNQGQPSIKPNKSADAIALKVREAYEKLISDSKSHQVIVELAPTIDLLTGAYVRLINISEYDAAKAHREEIESKVRNIYEEGFKTDNTKLN